MAWMATIPTQKPMVWQSAAQTSIGKLMSVGPQISIMRSFRDPEGSQPIHVLLEKCLDVNAAHHLFF